MGVVFGFPDWPREMQLVVTSAVCWKNNVLIRETRKSNCRGWGITSRSNISFGRAFVILIQEPIPPFPNRWLNVRYLQISVYTAMWGKFDSCCVPCAANRCWDPSSCSTDCNPSFVGFLLVKWLMAACRDSLLWAPGTQSQPKQTMLWTCFHVQGAHKHQDGELCT